jgi:hypothetical protein
MPYILLMPCRHICPSGEAQSFAEVAERLAEAFVQRLGLLLWRSARKVGSSSPLTFAIGDQRELADDERRAAGVEQRAVETALLVLSGSAQ